VQAGWVEADSAQAAELLDDTGQRPMTGRHGRQPRPRQHAHGRILRSEERVECGDLFGAQVVGELVGDAALSQDQSGRDEAFDDTGAGCHDPTAPQLLHQRCGNCRSVCGRERDRQQPGQEFAPVTRCEHLEAERLTQGIELLAPCLRPGRDNVACQGQDRILSRG
jgi:hypothetical protein